MEKKDISTSQKFNSLHEFAAWLNSTPVHKSFAGFMSSINGTKKFCDTASYEEANNLMLNGWDNGAKEIKKTMLKIAAVTRPRRQMKIGYTGVLPCIPAYLSGSPAHMISISIKKKQTSKPVITLFYNSSVSYRVAAKDITTAAAKLLTAIQEIEVAGVGVTLWCGSIRHSDEEIVTNAVKIKDSREPFNLLNVAYPLTHPSFNRRHSFAFVERCGGDLKTWKNYGCAVRSTATMQEELGKLNITPDVCLSYYDLGNRSKDEILILLQTACEKRQF